MSDIERFDKYAFENSAVTAGRTHTWHEDAVMEALGYTNKEAFRKIVRKAMQACLSLDIEPASDFVPVPNGSYRFTRFACYLIAMNGDPQKPLVATAQVYFASLADSIHGSTSQVESVERIVIRDKMTNSIRSLSNTADEHGVTSYAYFMNAGYRGMYNMNLGDLERIKGIRPSEKLLDRMGRTELAANLFRVTQTEDKIVQQDVRGQRALEATAFEVGRTVRETMVKIGGTPPENLPVAPPIKEIVRDLRKTGRTMKELSHPARAEELLLRAFAEVDMSNEDPVYTKDPEEDDGGSCYEDEENE